MTRILCIDPSNHCGWAHGVIGEKARFGVHHLPEAGDYTDRAINLQDFLTNLIKGNLISEVFVEQPILPKATSFSALMSIMGLANAAGLAAKRCGARPIFVPIASWRSTFIGATQAPKMNDDAVMAVLVDVRSNSAVAKWHEKGGATKERRGRARRVWLKNRVMEECRRRGYNISDDNDADAVGIYEHVCESRMRKAAQPSLDLNHGLTI